MNRITIKPFQLLIIFLVAIASTTVWSCTKTTSLQLTCKVTLVEANKAVIQSTLDPAKEGVGIQLTVIRNDSVVDRFNRTHNGATDFIIPSLKSGTNYKVEMRVINDKTVKAETCTSSFTTL